jgi:hypothetical protein
VSVYKELICLWVPSANGARYKYNRENGAAIGVVLGGKAVIFTGYFLVGSKKSIL